jgi:hypothetical protein
MYIISQCFNISYDPNILLEASFICLQGADFSSYEQGLNIPFYRPTIKLGNIITSLSADIQAHEWHQEINKLNEHINEC